MYWLAPVVEGNLLSSNVASLSTGTLFYVPSALGSTPLVAVLSRYQARSARNVPIYLLGLPFC
jgi:hypothetical protein